MINDFNNIVELMEVNSCDKFTIFNEKNKNSFFFKSNSERTFTENVAAAKRLLEFSKGQLFYVESWSGDQKTGRYNYEFRNGEIGSIQSTNIGNTLDSASIGAMIKNATDEITLKYERERLSEREKELKERQRIFEERENGIWGVAVNKLGPMLLQIASNMIGSNKVPIAVAGTNDSVEADQIIVRNQDKEEEQNEVISNLICRLLIVEPRTIEMLEKIVTMAENQDPTYNMAKGFLLPNNN